MLKYMLTDGSTMVEIREYRDRATALKSVR